MQLDVASILALGLLVALVFLAVRSNKGSPQLDRALVREHAKLKNRIAKVEADLSGCATKVDIMALSGKIEALEEHAASAGDINALEGKVNVALAKIDAVEKSSDRTAKGVERIETFLIEKGLGGR
jgi:hypothetical protein